MATRDELIQTLNGLLQPQLFRDYGPNGLQVQGADTVQVLASGVTASMEFLEAAVAAGADSVVVHHGLFWRGYDGCITGWLKERLALIFKHDLNVLAYHLPLDAHDTLGNNAQWGARLGMTATGRFGDQSLGWLGTMAEPTLAELTERVQQCTGRTPTVVAPRSWASGRRLRNAAWCTGGAQGYFEAAIAQGVDVFLTGEISEPQAHYARETGVVFMACGHHATERYGAPAVAEHVAEQLGLTHLNIDIDNPA